MRFPMQVRLYVDESGDYGFPSDRFDCYVQAALLCPDRLVDEVESFVADRKATWSLEELHASELDDQQLVEVAEFIAGSRLSLLASVTDTALVTLADIERHRLDQAATTKRNLDQYVRESAEAGLAPVSEIEQWMDRMIKRAGLAAQISHGEFVQAQFLGHLISTALQKSILIYSMDERRDDSWDFDFVIDGKLPLKKAAGEKYLDDMILPALGSQGRTLAILGTWKDAPVHPFVEKYSQERGRIRGVEVEGVIDLKGIFSAGLKFEPSHEHGGIQLIDTVAYTIRRAVLSPDEVAVQHAFDLLRWKLLGEDRRALTIHQLRGSTRPTDAARERYRPLHAEYRQ
jgi:hypothetical protein